MAKSTSIWSIQITWLLNDTKPVHFMWICEFGDSWTSRWQAFSQTLIYELACTQNGPIIRRWRSFSVFNLSNLLSLCFTSLLSGLWPSKNAYNPQNYGHLQLKLKILSSLEGTRFESPEGTRHRSKSDIFIEKTSRRIAAKSSVLNVELRFSWNFQVESSCYSTTLDGRSPYLYRSLVNLRSTVSNVSLEMLLKFKILPGCVFPFQDPRREAMRPPKFHLAKLF